MYSLSLSYIHIGISILQEQMQHTPVCIPNNYPDGTILPSLWYNITLSFFIT